MSQSRRRRIMRAFKLNEISAVDVPAQEGARMVLMKRHDDPMNSSSTASLLAGMNAPKTEKKETEKGRGLADVFTSSDDGHQHGVMISNYDDGEPYIRISYASGPDGKRHSHDIMRGSNGELILSENEGHTHSIDADVMQQALMNMMIGKVEQAPVDSGEDADNLGNQPTEDNMADKNAGDLSAELKKKDDEIRRLSAILDLTPEHRAHYDTLTKSAQSEFLSASHSDRDSAIQKAEDADPVVYKAADGTEYRKSDDSRLVDAIKRMDDERAEMAKFRVEAEQSQFEKRADELLGLIPGEKVEKIALVRAVAKIDDDETRDKVSKLLEGANKVYKMALTTTGYSETSDPEIKKASATLSDLAKAVQEKDPTLRPDQAMTKVLETTEGQRLYAQYQRERREAQQARSRN